MRLRASRLGRPPPPPAPGPSRGASRPKPPGHLPRPRVVQCLPSPGGSSAPSSGPDGFRNRVAAVSAPSQPHLCRPALGSPTAQRSQPGKPTPAGTAREPPPAAAASLDAEARQVSGAEEDITLCLPAHPSLILLVPQGLRR
ncbi:CDC42 small effector protein 1 isoform X1 [Panthera pardus]|uniref:CDC42 small effector protein 1 isoform X1 n=1 Tax=Panthera pardus TaxID=9691 RepID=A0A9W2UGY1_PANPR|nr:CDC42 small effector protein 1 isoform X1 [Panthera pardus]